MSRPLVTLLVVGAALIAIAAVFILLTRCEAPVSTPVPTLVPTLTPTATPTLAPTPTPTATATPTPAPISTPTMTPTSAPAQGFPVPDKEELESPELGTALDDLVSSVESGAVTEEEAAKEAPVRRGKSVGVTIHLSGNVDGVVQFLEDEGVTPRHVGEDYIEAFVPVRSLREISEMPGVLYVETIVPPQGSQEQPVQGNGPEAHGSAAWNEAGFTGNGIKIGIIDAGFEGISQLLGTELPETVKARCYGTETDDHGGLENCGWGDHGTLVAESIIDIAPEASLYLGAAWSKGDLADIVDWMISEGVSVINMSLGWTFDGSGDGTSPSSGSPLNTLTRAVDSGIVWINSAGNEADSAWFGSPGDSDGDGVLEFADTGEQLNLHTTGPHVVQLRWEGSWGGQTMDLDLYVYDSGGRIVRRSLNPQKGGAGHNPYEIAIPTTGANTILQVANRSDNLPRWMQIVVWNGDIGESSQNGSITNPGESASPGMLAVGAAHWENTDTIERYSSRGPAPDGRIKPDVVGAACGETALQGAGGAFCGTSQASPHVAGLAALVRQKFPDFTPQNVVQYLVENAQERGRPGYDNTWGTGFSTLPTPTPSATSTPVAISEVTPTPPPVPTATSTPSPVPTATPTPSPVPTATPTPTPAPNRDRHALEALYIATDGDNWEENGNWLSDAPLDQWYGVSIDDAGRVTGLDLRGNKLTGELPEELGYLSELEVFELWGNSIFGEIPASLGDLSQLTVLDLGENVLEGEVPEPLGNLDRLEKLYLSGDFHDLTGCIPVGLSDVPNNDFDLLGLPFCGPVAQEGESPDRSVLEIFYHATDGDNWTNNTNWLSDRPVGEWYGVTTDDSGNVTGLVLNDNQLNGQIPPELGSLANLQHLDLWNNNQLSGQIPSELGNLANLRSLRLADNQFSGQIPSELGNLANLGSLILGGNQLSGQIPPQLGNLSNLTWLTISRTQLTGTIPAELGNLSNLERLFLTRNQLTGQIPPELGNLSNLERLFLVGNQLSGCVPASLRDVRNNDFTELGLPFCGPVAQEGESTDRDILEIFYHATGGPNWTNNTNWLSDRPPGEWHGVTTDRDGRVTGLRFGNFVGESNNLAGTIPPELGSLSSLTWLQLLNNQLTGEIPPELGNLSKLTRLDLGGNQFSGSIPVELGSLSNLTRLGLENNRLTGEIPTELGNLSNLTILALSENQLGRSIPVELGSLSNLTELNFAKNQLSGEIPPELGDLSNLTILALTGNQLSGQIPPELGNLSNLTELYLLRNELSGEIPPELGRLSNLKFLNLQSNRLSGEIPPALGSLSSLTRLILNDNQLSGEIPSELASLTNLMGLGLGQNQLSGEIPPELGSLANLELLWLNNNRLSGAIPSELGSLANLAWLFLSQNQLTGPLPLNLTRLTGLTTLYFGSNDGLCAPTDAAFQQWLQAISNRDDGTNCTDDRTAFSPDRDILEIFYNATDGPNWTNNTNWLSDRPVGEWRGVTTDDSGNVTGLVLDSNQLSGQLPSELGSLSNLTGLWLYGNQLTGEIPQELGSLSNLTRLVLGSNQLSGEIPADLGKLSNLTNLRLANNELTGEIPTELGSLSNLDRLYLNDNQLSGEIPADLGKLSNLTGLRLGSNQLTGEIPPELGNLTNLRGLILRHNDLSGEIPTELGSLSNLTYTALEDNDLSGEIPPELGSLSNLTHLFLNGNKLSGPVPSELGSLSNLTYLSLRQNQLTGPLPLSLTGLTELSVLYFSNNAGLCAPTDAAFQRWLQAISNRDDGTNCTDDRTAFSPDRDILEIFYNATDGPNWTNNTNWLSDRPLDEWHGVTTDDSGNVTRLALNDNQLSGEIPPELGSLSNLTELWLSVNQLSGEIPAELGSLSSLTRLILNDNQLSGEIPSELGRLSNLMGLGLDQNQLSGEIPPELGRLSSLTELALINNELSGEIPSELGSLSNLAGLSLGGNELSGEIPSELGSLSNLTGLSLVGNQLSGEIPDELGNLSNLERLFLGGNELSGEIPPELGRLANLELLWLNNNRLSGAIPSELGRLSNLTILHLSSNQLRGSLPLSLTGLTELSGLYFNNNAGICAPTDAAFQQWLQAISNRDNGPNCEDATGTDTTTATSTALRTRAVTTSTAKTVPDAGVGRPSSIARPTNHNARTMSDGNRYPRARRTPVVTIDHVPANQLRVGGHA